MAVMIVFPPLGGSEQDWVKREYDSMIEAVREKYNAPEDEETEE